MNEIKPFQFMDGAKVLYWSWSGDKPFGKVSEIEIFGLAICQYENSETVYRFSCNNKWETEQDSDYNSVAEAIKFLPEQYKNVPANWVEYK